jgi:hypothetical protein
LASCANDPGGSVLFSSCFHKVLNCTGGAYLLHALLTKRSTRGLQPLGRQTR